MTERCLYNDKYMMAIILDYVRISNINNTSLFEEIEKLGIIDKMSSNKEYLLKYTVMTNNMAQVKRLVNEGGNIHFYGDEFLIMACYHGYLDLVKYMIEKCKCKPDAQCHKPFMSAIAHKKFDVAAYLVEHEKNIVEAGELAMLESIENKNNEGVHFLCSFMPISPMFMRKSISSDNLDATKIFLERKQQLTITDSTFVNNVVVCSNMKTTEFFVNNAINFVDYASYMLEQCIKNNKMKKVKLLIETMKVPVSDKAKQFSMNNEEMRKYVARSAWNTTPDYDKYPIKKQHKVNFQTIHNLRSGQMIPQLFDLTQIIGINDNVHINFNSPDRFNNGW